MTNVNIYMCIFKNINTQALLISGIVERGQLGGSFEKRDTFLFLYKCLKYLQCVYISILHILKVRTE
jgi:hypothetical protein